MHAFDAFAFVPARGSRIGAAPLNPSLLTTTTNFQPAALTTVAPLPRATISPTTQQTPQATLPAPAAEETGPATTIPATPAEPAPATPAPAPSASDNTGMLLIGAAVVLGVLGVVFYRGA